jgi:HK97 family phage portal protein
MGFFDRAIGTLGAATPAPTDDFWYNPVGQATVSGITLTPEGAQKVSAFYRGVDILSTATAMLPCPLYRRLPDDGGREVARDNALYGLIQRQPNVWQDEFQWKRMMIRHVIFRGNGLNRIVPGPGGYPEQLWPLSPDCMRYDQNDRTGRLVYIYRDPKKNTEEVLTQDEVFHLRGATDDGKVGVGVVQWARESIGLAMATESYASRLFSQGNMFGVVLESPGRPDEELAASLRAQFQKAHSGLANAHMAAVLFGGMKASRVSMTGEETQFVLSRKFSINDIARWLGLPPHMLGDLDRSTNNNIEHQGQEFVTYHLGPWLRMFESAANMQLVLDPETYYFEFNRDALVRGDIAARWQAYQIAISTGAFTRNEVRVKENANKLPGLDKPLDPAHLTGKQEQPAKGGDAEVDDDEPEPREAKRKAQRKAAATPSRAELIVQESAARLLRKEIAAVSAAAVRHASDEDAFVQTVTAFYDKHAALVVASLQLPEATARDYCAGQANQVVNGHWTAALELWETSGYAAGVAAIALEDAA